MAEVEVKNIAAALDLEIVCAGKSDTVTVNCSDMNRPGLFLAGFHAFFDAKRVQVIGTAEYAYLMSLEATQRRRAIDMLFEMPFPFALISTNVEPIPELMESAFQHGTAVFKSRKLKTTKLEAAAGTYLNKLLAPMTTLHAVLMDIYGLGVLLTGESGIGKSETALELVKRGHRLVADDSVLVTRIAEDRLIGEAPEVIRHLMEIRGVGIINVEHMYGISSVLDSKSIDLVAQLEYWNENKEYDRLGIEQNRRDILGVAVPELTLPVRPGRNMPIILETAARQARLKAAGYNALEEIKERKNKISEE